MTALIFIDTNIYLDFYRFNAGDTSLSILQHFGSNHDRIITTTEVEMEYKKNRQAVILDSLKNMKHVEPGSSIVPAFLRESHGNRALLAAHKSLAKQSGKLKERTAKLLQSPGRNDPVYVVLQRLFKARGAFHLTRDNKTKKVIREEAKQRFLLGYPPRKPDDLSMVDAINWEWIVHCAKHCSDDIVIVTRDTDYGHFEVGCQ